MFYASISLQAALQQLRIADLVWGPSLPTDTSVTRFKTAVIPTKIMKFPEPFPAILKSWEISQISFLLRFY